MKLAGYAMFYGIAFGLAGFAVWNTSEKAEAGVIDTIRDGIGAEPVGKDPADLEREAKEIREADAKFKREVEERERRERDRRRGNARDAQEREGKEKPQQDNRLPCGSIACG